jgi:HK97 gp10 family phage protein
MNAKLTIDLKPLEGLKKSLVNKILRKAVNEAARTVRTAVKGNAQAVGRYGYLAKSIGIKVKIYKDIAVAVVGPRTKYQKNKGVYKKGKKKGQPKLIKPSKYAHFLEKGTKRSRAKPFLKPALDSSKDEYMTALAAAIERGIAAQLAKS